MSDTKPNASSAITKNEFEFSNDQRTEINSNDQHRIVTSDSVEYDDTLSVAYTSCSDTSNIVCNFDKTELDFRPNFIENIEPSNANIGSVCVENSTNVTFGSKTYFNGPVVIKHFSCDGISVDASKSQEESDKLNPLKKSTEQTCYGERAIRPSHIAFIVGSVAVLVTTLTVAGYYLGNPWDTNTTAVDYSDLEFIDRVKYGAQPSKSEGEPLALPVRQVIISHTATPNCTDYSKCVSRVLQIQEFHMRDNGWDDIGLNFLIGGDGRAYEGCGYEVGAHTRNYNRFSVCIAFIGDFKSYEAPEKQLKSAQRLIDYGISMNKIHPDYVLYGQRQLNSFDSPGLLLFNQIQSWPHWSKDIISL